MYFQEWPSGLAVPDCSVAMGGRAASIDNTPGNILSPQAPSQNVTPQVSLAVNACQQQVENNMLSSEQNSVLPPPGVESISPAALSLISGASLHSPPTSIQSPPAPLHSPAETRHATSLPLQLPLAAAVGFPSHSTPISPVVHVSAVIDRQRSSFALSRHVTDPTVEPIYNQPRAYQNQVHGMQRQSNTQPPYISNSTSKSPGATALNLALSQLGISTSTRGRSLFDNLVTKSKVHAGTSVSESVSKTQTAAHKKVKADPKGEKLLSQVMKSETYVALYCTMCNKMFASQSGLQRHINTAHKDPKDKPFKCQDCGKGFLSERTLKTHTNMHLGVYPYRCQYCSKGFPNQDNLKGHLASHTNVKEFKCDQCGQEFTYRTSLNQHIAKAHQP